MKLTKRPKFTAKTGPTANMGNFQSGITALSVYERLDKCQKTKGSRQENAEIRDSLPLIGRPLQIKHTLGHYYPKIKNEKTT